MYVKVTHANIVQPLFGFNFSSIKDFILILPI